MDLLGLDPRFFHFYDSELPAFPPGALVLHVPEGLKRHAALDEWYLSRFPHGWGGWNGFGEYFDFHFVKAESVCLVHKDLPLLHDPIEPKLEDYKTYIEVLYAETEVEPGRIFAYFPKDCESIVRSIVADRVNRINRARLERSAHHEP